MFQSLGIAHAELIDDRLTISSLLPLILRSMDAARPFLCHCPAAMDGNMETKMNSKSKVVFLAAFAVAVLVVPVSSYAAQQQQAKQAGAKKAPAYNSGGGIQTGRVYLLESRGPINTSAAENFQNHFTIDY